jgi:hypothetical protein
MPEKDTPQAGSNNAEQLNKDALFDKNNPQGFSPYESNSPIFKLEDTIGKIDHVKEGVKLSDEESRKRDEYIRKEIIQKTERVLSENLDNVIKTADICLKHRSPFPYEYRQNQGVLEGFANRFRHIKEYGTERPEVKAYMEKTAQDFEYLQAWEDNLEGFGTSLPFYFGGIDKMNAGMRSQRKNISSSDLNKLYYKNDSRFVLQETERTLLEEKFRVEGRKEITLRELGVRYNSDANYWTMVSVAKAQKDYFEEPQDKEDKYRLMQKMEDYEEEFVDLVFGTGADNKGMVTEKFFDGNYICPTIQIGKKEIPERILNYYSNTESSDENELYLALMKALLVTDAKDRLTAKVGADGKRLDKDEMLGLAKEVKSLARKIYEKQGGVIAASGITRIAEGVSGAPAMTGRGLEEKIADLAVKTTIIRNWAFMTDIHYCWSFKYSQDGKNREVEIGSIYNAGDDYTPAFPFFHNAQYDATARARSGYMPPSARLMNEQILRENPKKATEIMRDDSYLLPETRALIENLLSDNTDKSKLPEGIVGFSKEIKTVLKKLRWNYVTAFRKGDREVALPMFMPTFFNWDALTAFSKKTEEINGDKSKIKTKSLPDFLKEGGQLSEFSFQTDGEEAADAMLVNWNMGARWHHLFTESSDEDAEKTFFGSKSSEMTEKENPNVKELNKRILLAVRKMSIADFSNDNSGPHEIARPMWEIIIGSQLISLFIAKKHSVFSQDKLINLTGDEKRRFLDAVTKCLLRVQYLPSESNYSSINQSKIYSTYMSDYKTMLWFNFKAISEMSKAVSGNELRDEITLRAKLVGKEF